MLALHTQASPSTRPLSILGTGHALPQKIMTSAELDTRLQLAPGTVERLSGVHTRHFARANDTAAKLAAQAARQAMQAAQLEWDEIDCLVAASGTMDQGMPSNAALIHRELGLSSFGIPAFDINASCLGFITALDVLSWSIAAGQYRRVLVVAADLASYGLDWKILESSTIFGDGAACVLASDCCASVLFFASRPKIPKVARLIQLASWRAARKFTLPSALTKFG